MSWFGINKQVKALAVAAADAYVERAQLTSRLLSVQPSLSDYEFAIFWALSALVMHRAEQAEIDPSQHVRQLHANSREFFDSFCQSFLRNVLGSDLVLTPDSPKILALMTEFLDNIPPDRAREIAEICSALARNASTLSGANKYRVHDHGALSQPAQTASVTD